MPFARVQVLERADEPPNQPPISHRPGSGCRLSGDVEAAADAGVSVVAVGVGAAAGPEADLPLDEVALELPEPADRGIFTTVP